MLITTKNRIIKLSGSFGLNCDKREAFTKWCCANGITKRQHIALQSSMKTNVQKKYMK